MWEGTLVWEMMISVTNQIGHSMHHIGHTHIVYIGHKLINISKMNENEMLKALGLGLHCIQSPRSVS